MSELIEVTTDEFGVTLLRLNRPEARNALSPEMMEEIASELERIDPDPEIRCVVIAGSEDIFAAGADIRAMSERTFAEALRHPAASFWRRLAAIRTPMVAAVTGYALGGGCELALACDMIVASEDAPLRPAGDHPRDHPRRRRHPADRPHRRQAAGDGVRADRPPLRRADGAADGPVNKVTSKGNCLQEALELARTVAERPPIAVRLAKQAVLAAEETALSAGIENERRLYELAMATEDRVEGMQAFLEKREPKFEGQ